MGLLRACADAVVIGSGTMRGLAAAGSGRRRRRSPTRPAAFAELRARLGRPPEAEVVVLIGERRASTRRTRSFARRRRSCSRPTRARRRWPAGSPAEQRRLARAGPVARRAAAVARAARARPPADPLRGRPARVRLARSQAGLVDELFLTVSPLLAGRLGGDERLVARRGRRPAVRPARRRRSCSASAATAATSSCATSSTRRGRPTNGCRGAGTEGARRVAMSDTSLRSTNADERGPRGLARRTARVVRAARHGLPGARLPARRLSSATGSPSGRTTGMRAATRSSATASSTTRSPRSSGSSCSPF